jgi:PAS domain S-box-containing protein
MSENGDSNRIKELEAELAKTKAQLEDKSNLFEHILEATMAGFWDWDIPANTEYLSPTFKQMFGYQDHEMENSPESWKKIIHPDDLATVLENFEEHVKSKGEVPFDNNVRYYHKDKSIVNVWCRGRVIEWTGDGAPKRMVGSHVNISNVLQVNHKYEKESNRLNLIIKGVDAGIWDWDLESDNEWWSDKLYSLLGYKPNEINCSYETLQRLTHPEDHLVLNSGLKEHLGNRVPFKSELRIKTKNEGYKWFEVTGQAKWNKKGSATNIAGSLLDINQRKKEQDNQAKIERLLIETGTMAKVGGWEMTLGDMQPHWSDQVYRIHELPVGQQPPLDKALSFYPEPDRTLIAGLLDKAVEEGKGFDRELNFITAKNNHIFVRSICIPILDKAGETIKLRGVFQDITEKKKQEVALLESVDVLAEQNKRLTSFAHIVSHNLNSHTSNINTLTRFLEKAETEGERNQYLEMMKDASNRLETTIVDLNEIVKIQNNVGRSKKAVRLEEIYQGLANSLSGLIQEKEAHIDTNFKISEVEYVPAYLDSIFLNLFTNALKYKHPERKPIIKVRSFMKENSVWLSIEDNGIGINLERHGNKIFGMYKTFTKRADSRGLGLFITKTQVESLGGEISVESEIGKGTKFLVRLN